MNWPLYKWITDSTCKANVSSSLESRVLTDQTVAAIEFAFLVPVLGRVHLDSQVYCFLV